MNDLDMLLVGYAMGTTLALLVLLNMRRMTQPPTVVIQQAPEPRDSFGCGSIILFALVAVGLAVFIGAFGGY